MYETESNRERQGRALGALACKVGGGVGEFTSAHGLDGWITRGPKIIAFVEVKGVHAKSTERETVTLAVQKFASCALHNALDPNAPTLVAFAFDDRVGYLPAVEYVEHARLVTFGRSDRGRDEFEPGLEVDTARLRWAEYEVTG